MTQLAKINGKSLGTVIASIPQWITDFKTRKKPTRYSREGMSDMLIPASPVRLDEKAYNEAKQVLDYLLKLSSFPLSVDIVRETFKLVNGIVANPLEEGDFDFKVSAIYSVFSHYPACIFNEETAKKLTTLNKFFPSGKEIEDVLSEAKSEFDHEISNLKSIVGYGFYTQEDQFSELREAQEKRRIQWEEKENQERQHRINRLKSITQPLDDLNKIILEAVERYMPENYLEMDCKSLIQVFTEQLNIVEDQQIKAVLQEKINAIHSREKQIKALKEFGIIILPTKQRVSA